MDMNSVNDEVEQVSEIAPSACDPVELGAASEETRGGWVGLDLDGVGGFHFA
jgi:hypothetical protein